MGLQLAFDLPGVAPHIADLHPIAGVIEEGPGRRIVRRQRLDFLNGIRGQRLGELRRIDRAGTQPNAKATARRPENTHSHVVRPLIESACPAIVADAGRCCGCGPLFSYPQLFRSRSFERGQCRAAASVRQRPQAEYSAALTGIFSPMNAAQILFYVALGLALVAYIIGGVKAARHIHHRRWPTPLECVIGFYGGVFRYLGDRVLCSDDGHFQAAAHRGR